MLKKTVISVNKAAKATGLSFWFLKGVSRKERVICRVSCGGIFGELLKLDNRQKFWQNVTGGIVGVYILIGSKKGG